MTIQLSLVVWTIICFVALFFILRSLLFEPILKLMDAREKKISDAENAKEEARLRSEETRLRLASEREQAEQELSADREKKAGELRLEGKKQFEDAKMRHYAEIESYRTETGKLLETEMNSAESYSDAEAVAFLSHLSEN